MHHLSKMAQRTMAMFLVFTFILGLLSPMTAFASPIGKNQNGKTRYKYGTDQGFVETVPGNGTDTSDTSDDADAVVSGKDGGDGPDRSDGQGEPSRSDDNGGGGREITSDPVPDNDAKEETGSSTSSGSSDGSGYQIDTDVEDEGDFVMSEEGKKGDPEASGTSNGSTKEDGKKDNTDDSKNKAADQENLNNKGNEENSNYIKYKGTKVGLGVGGIGGAIVGGIAIGVGALAALPAVGVGLGIAAVGTIIGSFFNK